MNFLSRFEWWQKLVANEQTWIAEVFLVILLTAIANYLAVRFLRHLAGQLNKTRTLWDDILVESLSKPLAYLVWVIGVSWGAEIVDKHSQTSILSAVSVIRDTLVIALIGWAIVRFIHLGEQKMVEDSLKSEGVDGTTVMAIGRLLRTAVIITTALVILQSMGYSIEGVLAFGGIGGIAIGFAAKDLLANFFGGLMIYLDRPFAVGDWIRSPDQEIEGTVENIGWRTTRIRTFDKRPLYVPNSVFAQIAVENPSRMTNRRIYETIGVRYDDAAQVRTIVSQVRTMLSEHEEIDTNNTLIVNFNSFGASSLDFFIYTFTKTTDWVRFHAIKEDVLMKVYDIVLANGADVAFPTTTVRTQDVLQIEQLNGMAAPAALPVENA